MRCARHCSGEFRRPIVSAWYQVETPAQYGGVVAGALCPTIGRQALRERYSRWPFLRLSLRLCLSFRTWASAWRRCMSWRRNCEPTLTPIWPPSSAVCAPAPPLPFPLLHPHPRTPVAHPQVCTPTPPPPEAWWLRGSVFVGLSGGERGTEATALTRCIATAAGAPSGPPSRPLQRHSAADGGLLSASPAATTAAPPSATQSAYVPGRSPPRLVKFGSLPSRLASPPREPVPPPPTARPPPPPPGEASDSGDDSIGGDNEAPPLPHSFPPAYVPNSLFVESPASAPLRHRASPTPAMVATPASPALATAGLPGIDETEGMTLERFARIQMEARTEAIERAQHARLFRFDCPERAPIGGKEGALE